MELLPEELIRCFDQYHEMQEAHLGHLAGENPDIEQMNFERSKTYADLEGNLRSFLLQITTPAFTEEIRQDIALACNRRIATLLERDADIEKGIRSYRTLLSGKMQALRKGKTAVAGYGNAVSGQHRLVRLSG